LLKESENPPIVWPEDLTVPGHEGTWWVAHTKSRNEKALAQDLISQGIGYFLPMSWKVTQNKQRRIRTLVPLFGGYLFFCGQDDDRLGALRTNRIANVIDVYDQQQLVTELGQIEYALKAGVTLTTHDYIKVGKKCKVTAGALMGLVGVVVRNISGVRLVLQVDMLGQAASVEIDNEVLEVIDEDN
jgi:transcription antitermination factor NusG